MGWEVRGGKEREGEESRREGVEREERGGEGGEERGEESGREEGKDGRGEEEREKRKGRRGGGKREWGGKVKMLIVQMPQQVMINEHWTEGKGDITVCARVN